MTAQVSDAQLEEFANDYPVFVDDDPTDAYVSVAVAPPNTVPPSHAGAGDAYLVGNETPGPKMPGLSQTVSFDDRGSMGLPSATGKLQHAESMPPLKDDKYELTQQNDRRLAQRARSLGHGISDKQRANTRGNLAVGGAFGNGSGAKKWSLSRNTMHMRTYYDRAVAEHNMLYGTRDPSLLKPYQTDDDYADATNGRCWYTPESRFRRIWDALSVLFLNYVVWMVPLRVFFDVTVDALSTAWLIELGVDIFFLLDIWFNFRTGFVNDKHQVVMEPRKICASYVRGWFFIDFFSVLPISYIMLIIQETKNTYDVKGANKGNVTKTAKLLRLFRLAKLLRLARLRRIIKKYAEEFEGLMTAVKLIALLVCMLVLSHVLCCLWYGVGNFSDCGWVAHNYPCAAGTVVDCGSGVLDLDAPLNVSGAALHLDELAARCAFQAEWIAPDENNAGAHTGMYAVEDTLAFTAGTSLWARYLHSFWFMLSILLGSERGDIGPITKTEVVVTIAFEMLGCVIFGVIIGLFGSLLMGQKLLEAKVEQQLGELREFLEQKQISKEVAGSVRKYMSVLYRKKTGYNEKEVLENLPPPLAKKLMDELYRTQVKTVPMFNGMQEEAVVRICYALRPLACMEGDHIFKEGELGQEMYIMEKGAVMLSRYNITLATLGPGSFFGEGALTRQRYHHNRTAQAIQDCDLAFLTKADVHKIANDYPLLTDRITELADKRLKGENKRLNNVLDETAKSLGVEPHSEEMRKVIEATEALAHAEVTDPSLKQEMSEEKAVTMIQRHFRGRQERRKHTYRKRARVRSKWLRAGEMAKVQGANATTDVGPPLSGSEIDEAARNVQAKMMDEKVAVVKEAILRSVGPPKDSAAAPQLESVPEFEGFASGDFDAFARSVGRSLAQISQAQEELSLAVRRLERK